MGTVLGEAIFYYLYMHVSHSAALPLIYDLSAHTPYIHAPLYYR